MNIDISTLNDQDKAIFSNYLKNHFENFNPQPGDDLSFLDFWRNFVGQVKAKGAEKAINSMLIPQLPLDFKDEQNISAEIYPSCAGEIPVIKIKNTEDFENLVTNLLHKGVRPQNLSATGAAFVFGKTTRFIILSAKPYSNVTAKTLGLSEEDWQIKSMTIRLEHECTHYYTKRFFGCSQNHLHDELIADFFGLYSAFGEYKAEYFEYFMGIKGKEGSRLACYIPDCSPELFQVLKKAASSAAVYFEKWSKSPDFKNMKHEERIKYLCGLKLAEII
ncbi:hypothetical protein MSI_16410 [Treponema sp. JC4]|uniref:DUF7005 family protein n=1 Tax=Treponema sp. JC4 TaxID=1124982 RepID=UPI00025AFC04|nr:hypothetical protein [Treponema sp. JC4]EID84858.1 hypothetical protein MSI_16410 [Treponema sp. JC4]